MSDVKIGGPGLDPPATKVSPTDEIVGNAAEFVGAPSRNIPISAVRTSDEDHDDISLLNKIIHRAKTTFENFINGVLIGGITSSGVTYADKQRIDTSLDMSTAEMISDINGGGKELVNWKTIAEMQDGKGLHFDGLASGGQSVQIPDDTNIADIWTNGASLVSAFEALQTAASEGHALNKTNWIVLFLSGNRLRFQVNFSGTNGQWDVADIVYDEHSVLSIKYNGSDVSNIPTIHINGVPQTLTITSTPVGTITTDVGSDLFLGNVSSKNRTFHGEQYSHRFFNRIITDDEAKSWSNPLKQPEFKDLEGNQVAQTSGVLIIGKAYRTDLFVAGDDFSNVADTGASANVTGAVWIAIGTTPTTWTNSSELIREGIIFQVTPKSLSTDTWFDESGIGNNGDVDADVINDFSTRDGTWIPVISDASSGGNAATASNVVGRFKRDDNKMIVDFSADAINTAGMTAGNDLFIQGLPQPNKSGTGEGVIGSVRLSSITYSGFVTSETVPNASYIRFSESISGSALDRIIVSNLSSGSAGIKFHIEYPIE